MMEDGYKRGRKKRCCLVVAALLIGVALLISIMGATLLRVRKPVITLESASIKDMDVSVEPLRLNLFLNVSLETHLTVKNPNRVGLKYTQSSAFLDYRGQVVGQAPIPAGHISARQTLLINLTLTIMADRFLSNSQSLMSDLILGTIPLSTNTKISGKVSILFFKLHVVSSSTCSINITVASRSVSPSQCTYRTRL